MGLVKKQEHYRGPVLQLEKKIHHRFKNKAVAYEALCHKSYIYDGQTADFRHNERMEFLGDAVLGLIITDELFHRFGDYQEGELSVIKSMLIRRETLAALAKELDLGKLLFLSKGEDQSGGRQRDSIMANTLESVIGAIYLDAGHKAVKKFILNLFKELLDKIPHEVHMKEYKNLLQELSHIKFKTNPIYRIISETGPDHCKTFQSTVSINGTTLGNGEGLSKKEAEKNAAKAAYDTILNMPDF